MPWAPTTDFEEEVVNLQPDHDFIYGFLSEPQYPRPKAHTEYAATKKIQEKEQQEKFESTGKINGKLSAIKQVQRMTSTKPIGEQPSLDDWESNDKLEQETIGMMRYFGMGANIEQPFNQEVTIATHPVDNTNKVVKVGRKKVALFFDNNVFKLQEKETDSSSSFESFRRNRTNKHIASKNEQEADSSLNTSSSFSVNSFDTVGESTDSFSSAASYIKCSPKIKNDKCTNQYEKLLEDVSSLSINSSFCSKNSQKHKFESFKTAEDHRTWTPIFGDEDVFSKKENWPDLSGSERSTKTETDSVDDNTSEASSSKVKKENFLDRFIKPEKVDKADTTTDSASTSSEERNTYAAVAKAPKIHANFSTKKKESSDFITTFPPLYTPRKMYALKRNTKS